ncbi:MAG: dephospho-CoA kinase [Dehalococcoidales bacterium]|nr:dephospho-CoA kinase [Dehalococcoidales bacterium]
MKIIGLTGGIGSGKSTVSRFLAELGAVVIDADKVGHEAFLPGTPAWQEVVAAFGSPVLAPDGSIDRKKLGEVVFGNRGALSRLNRIMHSRMKDLVQASIERHRQEGAAVVVIEAPLLIEAGWETMVDEVWTTTAPEAVRLHRLQQRSGLSTTESLARIRSQIPAGERLKRTDVVINTDCSLDELKAKVKELWEKRLASHP